MIGIFSIFSGLVRSHHVITHAVVFYLAVVISYLQLTTVTNNLRTFIGLFRGQSKGTWHWRDFEWGWTSSCKWRFTECWCWYKSSQWVATMNHIYDTRLFCFFSIVRRLVTPTKDFVNFASHAANAHVHMVQSVGLCAWQLKPVN